MKEEKLNYQIRMHDYTQGAKRQKRMKIPAIAHVSDTMAFMSYSFCVFNQSNLPITYSVEENGKNQKSTTANDSKCHDSGGLYNNMGA